MLERPAERFALRPAGQRLGDGIEVGDAPVGVGGDDGVTDAAQRDPQQLAALVGAPLRERIASPIAMMSAQVKR